MLGHQRARLRKREHIEPRQETAKQIQLVKNRLFYKALWFGKMAINQLLCEMCEILREHRCAILCKRQSLFFYFITIYGANDVMTALTPLFNLIQKSGSEGSPLSQWRKLRPWKMNVMLIAF